MTRVATRPHAGNLVRFAANRPELLVLSADLTASCEADDFRATYPDRFISCSMAEQNMVSMAAGLAREGFVPYLHTFAVFLTRRVFDQVAMSVAYPNLKVRFVGFLPGITTPGGVTHQAIDDVALMRVIPNMSIFECADATEVEGVLQQVHEINGPVYIRMLRGDVPLLFPKEDGFGHKGGRLLASTGTTGVVSTGVCTQEAIRARSCLARRGAEIRHLHVNRIKPWPAQLVDEFLHGLSNVVSLENHSVIGGLGSAVAEQMASQGSGARLHRLGLQDTYAHGASKSYLMREYALDARALVDTLEPLLGRPFHITDEELETVEISTDRRLRAEDL